MANKINTRLILRNDTSANWYSSNKILLKGEASLAEYTIDGVKRYELRIGDGEHVWRELSSSLIVPWTAISGAQKYALSVSQNGLSACLSTDASNNPVGNVFSTQAIADELSTKVVVNNYSGSTPTSSALSTLVINKVSEDTYASLKSGGNLCADQIYSITGNTSSINNFGMPLISVASPSADSPNHWAATKGYVDTQDTTVCTNVCTIISSMLSNAWQYGELSAINSNTTFSNNNDNRLVIYKDIQNIVGNGITFGGVKGQLSDLSGLENVVPGQVYVLSGGDYSGKEYIAKNNNSPKSADNFIELGNETLLGDLASKAISSVTIGSTVLTAENNNIKLSGFALKDATTLVSSDLSNALNNLVGLSTETQICTAMSTDLNIKALAHKDSIALADLSTISANNRVGLSTQAQLSAALRTDMSGAIASDISNTISTNLSLGDLAHLDAVSAAQIANGAVTTDKIANGSVTSDKLSGWFVLSCGSATQDGNISASDLT